MIEYTTEKLIKKALNLCDLKNNNFLKDDTTIELLNDSYLECYQKAIDIGETFFLKSAEINGGDELPEDFYQLFKIYYTLKGDNFKKFPLKKGADYYIQNNKFFIRKGFENVNVMLDYFPIPKTLVYKKDGATKTWKFMLNADLPSGSTGTKYLQFSNKVVIPAAMDEDIPRLALFNYGLSGASIFPYNDIFSVNGTMGLSYKGVVSKFTKDENNISTGSGNNVGKYDIATGVYSANSISSSRRSIYNNGVLLFETPDYVVPSNIKITKDLKFAFYIYLGDLIRHDIENDVDEILQNNLGDAVFIAKVDGKNDYILAKRVSNYIEYTQYISTETSEETIDVVNVPSNVFYSFLAYDLAVNIKVIAGEDATYLMAMRDKAEIEFNDTMKQDSTPYVIEDVYNTNTYWF